MRGLSPGWLLGGVALIIHYPKEAYYHQKQTASLLLEQLSLIIVGDTGLCPL